MIVEKNPDVITQMQYRKINGFVKAEFFYYRKTKEYLLERFPYFKYLAKYSA